MQLTQSDTKPQRYDGIGVMSGSSLDGLDIAFVRLIKAEDQSWSYEWLATECLPYPEEWVQRLKAAKSLSVPRFLELHTAFGHYIGAAINAFLQKGQSLPVPGFIASHGHTIYHNPAAKTSTQIGDGAAIAAATGINTITDLRNIDIALGGQGAPIVPIGDRLLFGAYDALLNLGGIANISLRKSDGSYVAFDVCPCNQLLDYYAQIAGKKYDEGGALARRGMAVEALLARLSEETFYKMPPPKSLANEFSAERILPIINEYELGIENALATCVTHITTEISKTIVGTSVRKLLVTGGGAFNRFLIEKQQASLAGNNTEVVVPDARLIAYKEALVMALIGALRLREETNVFASSTGAARDSIGGAVWAGISIPDV